jgi:hypothetical protein
VKRPRGNGSGKFNVVWTDMGGWLRVFAGSQDLPENLPEFLSHALTDWCRTHPQMRLRCVVPIQKNGNTVELHAWYDAHVFPELQRPIPKAGSD